MQVSKWGNSLAVRLPAKLVAELGLKEGDEIEFVETDTASGRTVLQTKDRQRAVIELRRFRGLMPPGFKFDREQANARGPDDKD
jgi:antitoxin MazE